ncbi:MAG: hypothetical protein U0359_14000 [Byssovorax sp.]
MDQGQIDAALRRAIDRGGEAGARLLAIDWAKTPLGPIDRWSSGLQVTLSLVLGHGLAMSLGWGPELIQIYNDASIPYLGGKHPNAMGKRLSEIENGTWNALKSTLAQVVWAGRPVTVRARPMMVEREGRAEKRLVDVTYSAVRDESGDVAGVLATLIEPVG